MAESLPPLIHHPSPNFGPRPVGQQVQLVVLHYTGMRSGAVALQRLCDPQAQVSAHYLIEEDGRLFQLVAEDQRAWHAGVAGWRGCTNVNDISIGIELVNPGHEFGYRAFPDVQINSLLALLADIKARHRLTSRDFVGHSDVAPGRKQDPGELFPWAALAQHGFGDMPAHSPNFSDTSLVDVTPEQSVVLGHQFAAIGYALDGNQPSSELIAAFQRRWRQSAISGRLDKGTLAALAEVAALYA